MNHAAKRLRDTKLPRLAIERKLMVQAIDRLFETIRKIKARERGVTLQ